jgi:predicted ATPase
MTASGEFDTRPVRAFLPGPDVRVDEIRVSAWPASVPALAQVLRDGLELPAGLTVLVGENGSGKSTVVETLAEAYGLNPQGGSALGQSFRIRESEPGVGAELTVVRGVRPRWSYFLRADTMHQLYTYLEQNPGKSANPFHELSHGEGILEILRTRVNEEGFYLMDEPGRAAVFRVLLGLAARPARGHRRVPAGVVGHPLPFSRPSPGPMCSVVSGRGATGPRAGKTLSSLVAWRQFSATPRGSSGTCWRRD